jgi:protein-S-isoprenylcysteine O-methyltransferase Ste14
MLRECWKEIGLYCAQARCAVLLSSRVHAWPVDVNAKPWATRHNQYYEQGSSMNTNYLVFLGFYLGSLIIRTCYELLKKAGKVNPKSTTVFAVIFVVMCLMWVSWFNMGPLDPWRLALPSVVRWFGLSVVIVGMGLAVGALVQLRGLENIDHLVTAGLFSKLRHPMYTGFILWILGWAIFHGAVVSLVVGFVGIGNILYWRRLEDENLEEWYGESYREYRQRTWF